MRKLYWGRTEWGNRGTEVKLLVQSSDQICGRAPGEIQALHVLIHCHHHTSFLFPRTFNVICEKMNKSEGHRLCIRRKAIHTWFAWGRLNWWGRFKFCCILIIMKSETDFMNTTLEPLMAHAVCSADSYMKCLGWQSQCSRNWNQPFEWGRCYVLPG